MARLVIPREHGAWAMLLLPFVTGAVTAGWTAGGGARVTLGAGGSVLMLMARSPAVQLARRRYKRGGFGRGAGDLLFSMATYSLAGLLLFSTIMAIDGAGRLWGLAALALAGFCLQTWLAVTLGERSMAAEVTGVALLTLTAALGFTLAGGQGPWAVKPMLLWALNASFYGASIFNVKMKVASMTRRRRRFPVLAKLKLARVSIVYLGVMILAWSLLALAGLVPALAPVTFLPAVGYIAGSLLAAGSRLNIKREGFIQLGLALVFTVLVIIAWRSGV